jgi:type VII secretion-associated protein (TIGR03931 family)
MTRVAVQLGAAWLRVAVEGRLLAALPAAGSCLPAVLAGLFDAPLEELVVVHAAGADPRPAMAAAAPTATVVQSAPAAVAALAQHVRSTGGGMDHAVVVDTGYAGTEVARVVAGRVVAVRRVAVGGACLDALTAHLLARKGVDPPQAEARRVREELSLLPDTAAGTPPVRVDAVGLRTALAGPMAAIVAAVRAVVDTAGPGRAPPVLLVGGVARTPLLAELLDAAGVGDVRVARQPDAAAVVGALLLPPDRQGSGPPRSSAHCPVPAPGPPAGSWLPPVARCRPRPSRLVLAVLAVVTAIAGLLGAGAAVPASSSVPPVPSGALVQYGYTLRLPAGWAHTGGLPERRRSLLTPLAAPEGSDLISVERTPLGYDADAEPARVRAELHAEFLAAASAGQPLSAFDADARFAGRSVVSYREAGTGTEAAVDWYVVLDGDVQLSVGCRHTEAGTDAVRAACETVVGSVHRT